MGADVRNEQFWCKTPNDLPNVRTSGHEVRFPLPVSLLCARQGTKAQGQTQQAIADRYGLTKPGVAYILRRQRNK